MSDHPMIELRRLHRFFGSTRAVHDVSFEHRTWEAEVRRDGMKRGLRLDPLTGEVVEDRVDD